MSGSVPPLDRPGCARAVEQLRRGDVLLVAKRDRLGRDSLRVALLGLEVAKLGARIISAAGEGTEDDSPQGRLMTRIIDAFAEYERDVIRDRTKKALGAKRARGERAGAVPYGYRLEAGLLVEDSGEQAAIAMMKVMRSEGAGYARIAKALTVDGAKARGSKWFAQSVRTILETQARHESAPRGTKD